MIRSYLDTAALKNYTHDFEFTAQLIDFSGHTGREVASCIEYRLIGNRDFNAIAKGVAENSCDESVGDKVGRL